MKNIRPLVNDDLDKLDEVILDRQGGRNRDLFNRIKKRLKKEWTEYLDSQADISKFQVSDTYWKNDKDTYINLYTHARDPIAKYKTDLKASHFGGLETCPYCGLPNVSTIDHFFPKSIFPQFSFLFRNLVPSCYDCNRIKDDKEPKKNEPFFLHPYFNSELSQNLLFFNVSIRCDTAVFELCPISSLSIDLKKIVEFQIKELKLYERLNDAAKTPWNGLVRNARNRTTPWDKEDIIKFVSDRAQDSIDQTESYNNINFIIYTGIAKSVHAIDFLESISTKRLG
ncbi:hypothetical protein CIK05_10785 [Bdellovibrio sp. qaytius]|nr:hypothetical protein CIK05_10785 [Bdellovibrio sp. qaytius]